MEAIAVHEAGGSTEPESEMETETEPKPELIDIPKPSPRDGEALVRILRVGVDGTDHEVISGDHGETPENDEYLVLGHEAVGVVEDPNGTDLSEGDVVVPMVRRPPGTTPNEYFERGEADMAPAGQYLERGIVGAHGFMSEYISSSAEYLVSIPDELASLGFLIEPVSIAEKAIEHAVASRAAFEWSPESALVLGNGSLGLLTLAMLDSRSERTYCLGRRDRPDPTIDIIEALGATYIDSRETPVREVGDAYEPMDFVFEATGYAPHAFETIEALAPNGVGALVGVPGTNTFEIDGGTLHREWVLHNKALLGTVNSGRPHFERAVRTLDSLPDWFLADLVTDVAGLDSFERAFRDGDSVIKTAIEFSQLYDSFESESRDTR